MRNEILSERPNLFEPDAYIGFVLDLTGNIACEQVKSAVLRAYQVNETTMSRIVLTEDGRAYYERMEQSGCSVTLVDGDPKEVFVKNRKTPFRLKEGELIRTFLIPKEQGMTMLIMAHHLAGDGKALAKFAEEILAILDEKTMPYRSANILTKEDFKRRGSLPGIYMFLVKLMNAKWDRHGKIFTWDDYEAIHQSYWENRDGNLQVQWIEQREFAEMKENAKRAGVTINSWLLAEIQRKYAQKELIGIPISVRGSNDSMNNMTSGIRIRHVYQSKKSVCWNARQIHKKTRRMLSNCHIRYLAISFVAEVKGSLVDGVLMQTHRLYEHSLTRKMSRAMGYLGKRKTQLGISNLGILDIPADHGNYKLERVLFIPPKVSYADQIIGISTFGKQVCVLQNICFFQPNTIKFE